MSTDKKGGIDVIDRPPEKKKQPPKPPRKFKVIYHNDDFRGVCFLDFDENILTNRGGGNHFEVHKLGAAVAGIYDYQIAEQKVYEVMELAKENDYPLKITGEPTE